MTFLGASTGRSGSMWIVRVFNLLGFTCTHEQYFNARRDLPWQWPALKGEWSAQCVPFLADYDVPIFHQVRHPLKVIGSYIHRGWFADIDLGLENQFMVDHAGIDRKGNPMRELARFYVDWNRRIEKHADLRWQVEQFDDQTATLVSWQLEVPTRSIPNIAPTNRSSHPDITWADVPEPERTPLKQIAEEYGYCI